MNAGSQSGDRWARLARLTVVAAVAAVALLGCAVLRPGPPAVSVALARGARPPAPEFRLPRFPEGMLALSDLRGRIVLLNFWASWCLPCRDEAPLLERVWRTYGGRGVTVVGINIHDRETDARRFLLQTGIGYPNLRDPDGRVGRLYGITGLPETFFIGGTGRVVGRFPGAVVDWEVWQEAVERLLANQDQQ
ncbi:MAG: TlpA family protein disulfide reductase [Armatimonadetes bacterium]|nr:TlpA family protein disulfide reductase [Armatimonadota bacterium]